MPFAEPAFRSLVLDEHRAHRPEHPVGAGRLGLEAVGSGAGDGRLEQVPSPRPSGRRRRSTTRSSRRRRVRWRGRRRPRPARRASIPYDTPSSSRRSSMYAADSAASEPRPDPVGRGIDGRPVQRRGRRDLLEGRRASRSARASRPSPEQVAGGDERPDHGCRGQRLAGLPGTPRGRPRTPGSRPRCRRSPRRSSRAPQDPGTGRRVQVGWAPSEARRRTARAPRRGTRAR